MGFLQKITDYSFHLKTKEEVYRYLKEKESLVTRTYVSLQFWVDKEKDLFFVRINQKYCICTESEISSRCELFTVKLILGHL